MRGRLTARKRRRWPSRWFADQADTPACVGFAAARLLEAAPIRQFVAPAGVYALAQHVDEWEGTDYDGTSVRAGAKVLSLLGFLAEYRWAWELDPIIGHLQEAGPVLFGLNWYAPMCEPNKEGIIVPSGAVAGGHAILADEIDLRRELVGLNNSWGRRWGLDGRCYLHLDHLARLLREDGEACCGVEAKPQAETISREMPVPAAF